MSEHRPFSFADLGEGRVSRRQEEDADQAAGPGASPLAYGSRLTDFRRSNARPKREAKPERLYTADELASAVDEAMRRTASEVEAAVRAAMAEEIEQRRCELLSSIMDQLARQQSAYHEEVARAADTGYALALALVQAIVPKAIENQPLADIGHLVRTALARLTKEPSVELRLSPALADAGRELLSGAARDLGWQGEVSVSADMSLQDGDAELRWAGGAIERDLQRLQEEAVTMARHWIWQPPPEPAGDAFPKTGAPASNAAPSDTTSAPISEAMP